MYIKQICSTIFLIFAALMINSGLCVIEAQSFISSVEIIPETPTEMDDITLKVYGSFPDSCWGYISGEYSINNNQIFIDLYTHDIWEPSTFCLTVVIPYSDEFNIGQLVSGEYSINVTEYRDSLRVPSPGFYSSEFIVSTFVDADSDGIHDSEDNCPEDYNPAQEDGDCDGIGNVCDVTTDCIEGVTCDDDCDGFYNQNDNCLIDHNPNQEDTCPPQGNGIGDACDCECDFDCSGGVDADDVTRFLLDFGRNEFNDPCTNDSPCNGDVDCNGACDADDVTMFLQDFGRNEFNNPCPACEVGNWCVYP